MSTIRLSNRDVNHIVCVGGEIEDVKFSAEKAIAVERAGSDAWVKFLVKEVDDMGMVTRSYVKTSSGFFINCNGAIYPRYAEHAELTAKTFTLTPGRPQHQLAHEERIVPRDEDARSGSTPRGRIQDSGAEG